MINFNQTIINPEQIEHSWLWQGVENYLNIGQQAYRVVKIEKEVIFLESSESKPSLFLTIAKILSYCLIFPAIISLGIRELYRRSSQFEIIHPQDKDVIETGEQSSNRDVKELDDFQERPLVKVAYKLEGVIARLLKAKDSGLKLGLFVGRTDEQTIPQEKGWIWCSLDNSKDIKELPEDRLHLNINFNDEESMDKIQGIFDKVVSDYSVIKFMGNPWNTLRNLLVTEAHAELVAESWSGGSSTQQISTVNYHPKQATMVTPASDFIHFINAENKAFNDWKQMIGEEIAEFFYGIYVSNMPQKEKDHLLHMHSGNEHGLRLSFKRHTLEINKLAPKKIDHVPGLLSEIEKYLLELFQEVKLEQGYYPYREGNEAIQTDYWVARNPKPIII